MTMRDTIAEEVNVTQRAYQALLKRAEWAKEKKVHRERERGSKMQDWLFMTAYLSSAASTMLSLHLI